MEKSGDSTAVFCLILVSKFFLEKTMKTAAIFLLMISSLAAQQQDSIGLQGNLSLDQQIAFQNTYKPAQDVTNDVSGRKSPLLAALMSLAVPGAGEIYSGSYLKAGVFIAVEIAAVAVGLAYDKKGDDQTDLFQDYANERWDVAKYARWTIDNIEHLNNSIGSSVDPTNYGDLFANQERTKVNWNALNRLESDIGGWYSHRLERFGEQQYYEMIGKYPQFNPGWDDFDENSLYTYNAVQKDPVTANFDYYSGLRGEANDFYDVASSAVIVVIVNHFVSALDAAWSASRYNKRLELNMSIEKQQLGFNSHYYPQVNMQFNF